MNGARVGFWVMGRIGWVLVGVALTLVACLSCWERVFPYREVETTRVAIIVREVPSGPPGIRDRIVYVYLQPDVRAIAPGAVMEDVERFCRPILIAQSDPERPTELGQDSTERALPSPSVIRSFTVGQTWLPFQRNPLLVTSMNGYGDLVAEDYRVRLPLGVAAGLEEPYRTTVRYPRWAPLYEIPKALGYYAILRALEAVVR